MIECTNQQIGTPEVIVHTSHTFSLDRSGIDMLVESAAKNKRNRVRLCAHKTKEEKAINNIDALINLANYYSNENKNEKSISLLDSLKESDKQSKLARMVRLKLRINISENISEDIKKEFNELTDEMSKTTQQSLANEQDEDLAWLTENEKSGI